MPTLTRGGDIPLIISEECVLDQQPLQALLRSGLTGQEVQVPTYCQNIFTLINGRLVFATLGIDRDD
ncbi:hypothetical protein ALP45_200001 [Pseudomonas coronafaciens pv. atropurpurea]|uniref:hypothetical protein n=1 Tax=Pseudomonas coronafaciens TaxID=53409 RepID=UPI0006D60D8C|nr:hypothetical protein [Pseudomonas coronafaciens]RMT61891.1 hypothetical protein ALP45_200001 [Pseudomonas coronafaciens pv. atropurpurea]